MPELSGTPFIRLVTGLIYIVTKPTIFGGFVVFSWLSFLGLFFFYKAIVVGFPEANHRRYAYLVFFLPSMLYWPSSIGKEAWISFGLGLASYGVALILRHQPLGYPVAGLGLLATAGPRPHITVLCTVALGMAYVLRRRSWSDSTLGPVSKVVGIVVMLAAGVVVVSKAAAFFEVDSVTSGSVDSVFEYTDRPIGPGRVRVRGRAGEVAGRVPQCLPGRAVPPVAVGGGQRPGAHRLGRGHDAARAVRGVRCHASCACPGTSSRCRTWPTRSRTRSCS